MKFPHSFSWRPAFTTDVRAIFERMAFVCYLGIVLGACGLVGLGLIFAVLLGEARPLCVGLAGGALARLLHEHGYRVWHFRKWEESFQPSDHGQAFMMDPVRAERVREMERLLGQLAALEENRGQRDLWAVQDLRHRATALLVRDPVLRKEFAAELTRYPEIG